MEIQTLNVEKKHIGSLFEKLLNNLLSSIIADKTMYGLILNTVRYIVELDKFASWLYYLKLEDKQASATAENIDDIEQYKEFYFCLASLGELNYIANLTSEKLEAHTLFTDTSFCMYLILYLSRINNHHTAHETFVIGLEEKCSTCIEYKNYVEKIATSTSPVLKELIYVNLQNLYSHYMQILTYVDRVSSSESFVLSYLSKILQVVSL